MSPDTFGRLVQQRWNETLAALGYPEGCLVTWEIEPNAAHFHTPRGYGVTHYRGGLTCHLQFAPKILTAPQQRADGVVRHEFGHVVDFFVPAPQLDLWARARGRHLAPTPERRADDIAYVIWGSPIHYDRELYVQTTATHGTLNRRPAHLGP